MPPKPNLFNFATKELSQDAFVCWLLQWADSSFSELDNDLYQAGRLFLQALLEKHGCQLNEVVRVKVVRQSKKIDILAEIDNDIVLLIEDKINAGEHGDQLDRYVKAIIEEYSGRRVLPIFLKTGDQCDYSKPIQAGYRLFLRNDFLSVLKEIEPKNAIFNDFRERLKAVDAERKAYAITPISAWTPDAWIGFFMAIHEADRNSWVWEYQGNIGGGKHIAYYKVDHGPYLQIEQWYMRDNQSTQSQLTVRYKYRSGEEESLRGKRAKILERLGISGYCFNSGRLVLNQYRKESTLLRMGEDEHLTLINPNNIAETLKKLNALQACLLQSD